MSDLVLSTGEVVPELAETAVVHEDGDWRLVRCKYVGWYQLVQWRDNRWAAQGVCVTTYPSRGWRVQTPSSGDAAVYEGENLDEAIAALWAARGTA